MITVTNFFEVFLMILNLSEYDEFLFLKLIIFGITQVFWGLKFKCFVIKFFVKYDGAITLLNFNKNK